MGAIKVIRSDDGKPYISLEDLIGELEEVKKNNINEEEDMEDKNNFLNVVLRILHGMEKEYYMKFLIKKPKDNGN